MNIGDIVDIIVWAVIILGGVWVYRRVDEGTGGSRRKSMYRGNDHNGVSGSRVGRGGRQRRRRLRWWR